MFPQFGDVPIDGLGQPCSGGLADCNAESHRRARECTSPEVPGYPSPRIEPRHQTGIDDAFAHHSGCVSVAVDFDEVTFDAELLGGCAELRVHPVAPGNGDGLLRQVPDCLDSRGHSRIYLSPVGKDADAGELVLGILRLESYARQNVNLAFGQSRYGLPTLAEYI